MLLFTPRGELRSVPFLIWAAGVLALYVILRNSDLTPMLGSLGGRSADLLLPVALLILNLPGASFLARRVGPPDLWTRFANPGRVDTRDESGAPARFLILATLSLGIVIVSTTLLGTLGLWSRGFLALVPSVLFLVCFREWPRLAADLGPLLSSIKRGVTTLPGTLWAGIAAAALLLTLTPATSQDALHYHLAVPQRWLAEKGLAEVPGNVYSRFPMNVEMLYVNALALRGEIAAKACHWLLAMLAACAVCQLAARFASVNAARWSAVIFLSTPTIFRVATWAYVEMGMVLFLTVAWLSFLRRDTVKLRDAILIGFLGGLACGTKYTLLLPVAALGTASLWKAERRVCAALLGCVAATVGGGFWYLRNLYEVGNPVFPFLYELLGGAGWDAERAGLFAGSLAEWGNVGWDLPWALTFEGMFASVEAFDGILGPVFLLAAPLVAIALRYDRRTRTTGALLTLLLGGWLATTRQMRFLVPSLALFSALIPAGWEALRGEAARIWTGHALLCGVLLSLTAPILIFSREAPLAFAVGLEHADRFRQRVLPGADFALFRDLSRVVPADGKVLFAASGNPVFLCERPYHADSVCENFTLRRLLREGRDSHGVMSRFEQEGFTHLLFRFPLVFGSGPSDLSSPEKELLARVLNRFGKLELRADETVLYRLVRGGEREE